MLKKFMLSFICLTLIMLCGCSQESKFGVQQFVERMNTLYETDFTTDEFILGTDNEGKNYLFCDRNGILMSLSIDTNNTICGVGLTITESMDINIGLDTFLQISGVFTGKTEDEQKSILTDCGITADKIKYADSNFVITVGKYKYSVICNDYSVTLFCDRV